MNENTEANKSAPPEVKKDWLELSEQMKEQVSPLSQALHNAIRNTPEGQQCREYQERIKLFWESMYCLIPENNLTEFKNRMGVLQGSYNLTEGLMAAAVHRYSLYETDVIIDILEMQPGTVIKDTFFDIKEEMLDELTEKFFEDPEHNEVVEKCDGLINKLEESLPEEFKAVFEDLVASMAEQTLEIQNLFFMAGIMDCLKRLHVIFYNHENDIRAGNFPDGSSCQLKGDVRLVSMGAKLPFVFRIGMGGGVIYENVQFDETAPVPSPGELAKMLEAFGASENA
jgi:hypothetical protein